MEHRCYIEYKRLALVEPPCLYYLLVAILVVLSWIFAIAIVELVFSNDFLTAIELIIIHSAVGLFFLLRQSRERALIHDNGNLEVYGFNQHTSTPIAEIKQVHFKKRFTICGNVIVIKLELKNGKVIKLLLKENEQFLAELKKHNSNIIIPELPVV